jgi:hypothetical protein
VNCPDLVGAGAIPSSKFIVWLTAGSKSDTSANKKAIRVRIMMAFSYVSLSAFYFFFFAFFFLVAFFLVFFFLAFFLAIFFTSMIQ